MSTPIRLASDFAPITPPPRRAPLRSDQIRVLPSLKPTRIARLKVHLAHLVAVAEEAAFVTVILCGALVCISVGFALGLWLAAHGVSCW